MASLPISKLTVEEYLEIERAAEVRSDFVDGEMFAMAGGSPRHLRLVGDLYLELRRCSEASSCEVFLSECRVRVSPRTYTYPDATIVCGGPAIFDQRDSLLNPSAIFEVLSPSTEAYDRGLKSQRYRAMPGLGHYILIDQKQVHVEHYVRQLDGWKLHDYSNLQDELTLPALPRAILLSRIYGGIDFAE